jgi:hypothetical protein
VGADAMTVRPVFRGSAKDTKKATTVTQAEIWNTRS